MFGGISPAPSTIAAMPSTFACTRSARSGRLFPLPWLQRLVGRSGASCGQEFTVGFFLFPFAADKTVEEFTHITHLKVCV